MNKETAARILSEYEENEELNLHAENLLLLAEAFEDENAAHYAKMNIGLIKMRGYARIDCFYRQEAYELCNHYYYQLTELVK